MCLAIRFLVKPLPAGLLAFVIASGIAQEHAVSAFPNTTQVVRISFSPTTVSGHVVNAESGENVIGATVYAPHLRVGATSNQFGFYSLTVEADTLTLIVSHVGYETQTLHLHLESELRLDIELNPATISMEEVEVVAGVGETHVERVQMSSVTLPIAQIQSLPALLGEIDVLKVVQLLPGVQSGREGTSGLYVRGGGPDQNLLLLDGMPVYNAGHLFGFMSVFMGDAIKDVSLIKGGFPARYGGRLSSVVEVTMKEGNLKEFKGVAAIGIVASRLTVEGPILKNRASFMISARRTYLDLLIRPFLPKNNKGGYFFYDVNAKANYILSERDRVYVSAYTGLDLGDTRIRDQTGINGPIRHSESDLGWRNTTVTARWNRVFSPRLFANTLVGISRYRLMISSDESLGRPGASDEDTQLYYRRFYSGITDGTARTDLEFARTPGHLMRFGVAGVVHTFDTGALEEQRSGPDIDALDTLYTPTHRIRARAFSAYVENEMRISPRFKTNVGVHVSIFWVGEQRYASVQPRVGVWFGLGESDALKASYAHMAQNIHLLTSGNGLSLPTDLWVPATNRIRPQSAHQVALGYARLLGRGRYELTIEGYYKWMDDLIEYKEGAGYLNARAGSWQDQVEHGRGWSYGSEFFLQKKSGRTTGWIGYTYSRTERKFAELNSGRTFPYKYDRRHDVSVAVNHRLKESVAAAVTWVYGTGQAVSVPIGQFYGIEHVTGYESFQSQTTPVVLRTFGSRNAYRMPAYHRLDVAIRLFRSGRWARRTLSFGAYNLYVRRNAFQLTSTQMRGEDKESEYLQIKKITVFPIVPFVTYQLEF